MVLARPGAAIEADELLIDSWLMSCRVLGREVEVAVLEVLADAAAAAGWRALVGEYRPTERNGMVAEHYPRLGFEQRPAPANAATDASFWRYELASRAPINHHIQVQA